MTLPFDAPRYNWTEQKIGNGAGHNIKGWTYQVYKVKDNLNNNTYAVKVGELKQITPDSLNSLSPVFSPALIPNLSYYVDSHYVYIVTPYCPRGNLETYITQLHQSKSKPSIEEVKGFMLNILDGLDFIHQYPKKYQIHGNIKPSNIFFSTSDINNQTIALGDIFHCQVFTDTFPISNCSSIELLESNDCTTNSDIWSLGCVLYFICTGQYPFPKKSTVDYIKEGKHGELLKSGKFECFNGLYENMISVDKKKRYSTKRIRELLNAISNNSVPASPQKKPPVQPPQTSSKPTPPSPSPSPPIKRKAKEMSKDKDDDDDEHIILKKANIAKPTLSFINPSIPIPAQPAQPAQPPSPALINMNNNVNPVTVNKLLKFIFDNYAQVKQLFNNYSGQLSYVILKAIEDVEGESLPSDTILYRILTCLTYTNLASTIRSICINGGYNFTLNLSSFQTCLSSLHNISVLRLNYVGLDDSSQMFYQSLTLLPNLRVVDVSHNRITDSGITAFMNGLANATGLTELNVGYNNIKQTGGNVIGSSLSKYEHLQVIGITSCTIGVNGFKNIVNGLTNDGRKVSSLISLYAENNSIGDQGFTHLASHITLFPHLQQLLISNNRKTAPSGNANPLIKSITNCSLLQAFTFQQNKISDLEMSDLCYSLNMLRDLRYLELGGNDLNNQQVLYLSSNIKNSTKLTYLGLGDNNFDRAGLQSLCNNTFPYLVNLESIKLKNADIKGTGIDDLCQCINLGFLKELKEVNLAGCKIKSEALKKLFVTFKKLPKLESLDISENQFDEKQILIIQNTITNYPNLKVLNAKDNHSTVDSNVIKAVKAAVSKSNPELKLII